MSSHRIEAPEVPSEPILEPRAGTDRRAHRCTICEEEFSNRAAALAHVPLVHFEISEDQAAHYVKLASERSAADSSALRRRTPRAPVDLMGHWHRLLEPIEMSPLAFYELVENAFADREVPGASICRVDYPEGGVASARREYLRIARGRHVCDVCAAPFGRGFFISWWLGEPRPGPVAPTLLALLWVSFLGWLFVTRLGFVFGPLVTLLALFVSFIIVGAALSQDETPWEPYALALPYIGPLWGRFFRPVTYYRNDTALMFQEQVHKSISEVIDGLTKTHGLRALSADERKPILRDFYRR